MKKYNFDVSYTSITTMSVIAESEEAAQEEVQQRFRNQPNLTFGLSGTKELEWFASRCDTELGAWYNDEYERIESNHENLGPFDSAEEALNAIRTQWGYCGSFTKSFDESYVATDVNLNGVKDYTVYAKLHSLCQRGSLTTGPGA